MKDSILNQVREIVEKFAPELAPDGDDGEPLWGIRKYEIWATDAEWRDHLARITQLEQQITKARELLINGFGVAEWIHDRDEWLVANPEEPDGDTNS